MNLYDYYSPKEKLIGYEQYELVPDRALELAQAGKKLNQQQLKNIASDAETSYYYAKHLGKRWPLGEPTLLKSPLYASYYATDVLKGTWPEAEKIIATNGMASWFYAQDVLGQPWPPGEAAITKDALASLYYSRYVIRGEWPPGEAAIAAKPDIAKRYEEDKRARQRARKFFVIK